jgi:hypothetical protein
VLTSTHHPFPPNHKESDLISLQDDAKRAGADAVTDIVSNYNNVEFRDTRTTNATRAS